ncbi:MAG TPA: hypothetical protein VEF04_23345, partial [Blastocatellia bacterium]|nr:hypothetical protein [Blastocatellia bacterium]
MDDNLKIVLGVFQDMAQLYRRFLSKSTELNRMSFVEKTHTDFRLQPYDKHYHGLVDPPPGIIAYIDVEAEIIDRPPICWGLDICRDEDFIYVEGRVYTSFESRDHNWLEIERKTDNLNQFIIDLREVSHEILKYP